MKRAKAPVMTPEEKAAHDAARDLDRRRNEYARLKSARSPAEVMASLKAALEGRVRGRRVRLELSRDDYLTLEVERAWAVTASLYVRLESDWNGRLVNPDNDREVARLMRYAVELSWSSTHRSVAAAAASVALYRELVELAAEVEAILAEGRIATVMNLDE
jgi:FAD/FMN-containing dehydrogenase